LIAGGSVLMVFYAIIAGIPLNLALFHEKFTVNAILTAIFLKIDLLTNIPVSSN
jgi:hypothetical protein